ncbi:MAG: agmatinase [Bdellovibrionales bacterium]|nr:agmatinase [Bdellovibrionales bacterium]
MSSLIKSNYSYYMSRDFIGINQGIYLVGFGFDGTACFRKGTKDGPDAIRKASDGIESYSPYLDRVLEDVEFYDCGNLPVGNSENQEHNWQVGTNAFLDCFKKHHLENGAKVLTIGGEHSISYAPISLYLDTYKDLVLIHLDAHADLRDGYEGYHYSHASVIRRALDHFNDTHELIQYGIRSGTKEEYKWMKENKTIKTSRQDFLDSVRQIDPKRPVYLTLDLDYFDPSFLPGTGTPEAGGEDFHSFVALTKILKDKNLVGADVVELSPPLDNSGNSDVFATKVVREILLTL